MTVIINGTDNSASTPAVTGTDGDTGMFYPAANTVALSTGGSERMRVDSSGNVGIGTTSPQSQLEIRGSTDGVGATLHLFYNTGSGHDYAITSRSDGSLRFADDTAATERARITPQGYFKASNNGTYAGATDANHEFRKSDNGTNVFITRATSGTYDSTVLLVQCDRNTTNNSYNFLVCSTPGVATKLIIADSGNVTNVNNSYGQISDIKTKQDVVDAGSQWDDIKNLRVRKFRFKNDPNGFLQIGVVAQEIEEISPGLIDESPDYEEVEVTDEDGNVTTERQATGTVTKSVKYSILYMKAVKALQEAMERIETLEAKVAALEGAE
jgi:hypothetical protein